MGLFLTLSLLYLETSFRTGSGVTVIGGVQLQCHDCPGNTDVRSKEIGLLQKPIRP